MAHNQITRSVNVTQPKLLILHNRFVFFVSLILYIFQNEIQTPLKAQPRYELRGVWVTTAFGIDFPKTLNSDQQKKDLEKIFKDLKEKKFNAVFFQVRVRADVMYQSPYEPYHEYAAGKGKSPEYDIASYAIELSHKYGLEFHAWFNTLILRGKESSEMAQQQPSLWKTHPDWIDSRAHKHPKVKDVYLNPSMPEVQHYLRDIIADFAQRYDVDGIQLDDYLRYPDQSTYSQPFNDDPEFLRYNPNKLNREDWRRENINSLVQIIHDTLVSIKPYLKFGVTPIGVYRRVDKEPAMESLVEVYQDSREWTKRKTCDYLAPQVYFHIGESTKEERTAKKFNPAFEKLVADWAKNKNFRHLFVGIGTYKQPVKQEWKAQIELCRNLGVEGFIFYPYHSISDLSDMFEDYALIPSMTWKSVTRPEPPEVLSVGWNKGNVILKWKKTAGTRWVNVYQRSHSLIVPIKQNMVEDSLSLPAIDGDQIFITSIDRYGNESFFSEPLSPH